MQDGRHTCMQTHRTSKCAEINKQMTLCKNTHTHTPLPTTHTHTHTQMLAGDKSAGKTDMSPSLSSTLHNGYVMYCRAHTFWHLFDQGLLIPPGWLVKLVDIFLAPINLRFDSQYSLSLYVVFLSTRAYVSTWSGTEGWFQRLTISFGNLLGMTIIWRENTVNQQSSLCDLAFFSLTSVETKKKILCCAFCFGKILKRKGIQMTITTHIQQMHR